MRVDDEFVEAVEKRLAKDGDFLHRYSSYQYIEIYSAVIAEYKARTHTLRPLRPKAKRTRQTKDGRVILNGDLIDELVSFIYERDARTCHLCGLYVHRCNAVPDHIEPCGMGGARRNDTTDAVKLAHRFCNQYRGSRRDLEKVREELRKRIVGSVFGSDTGTVKPY